MTPAAILAAIDRDRARISSPRFSDEYLARVIERAHKLRVRSTRHPWIEQVIHAHEELSAPAYQVRR